MKKTYCLLIVLLLTTFACQKDTNSPPEPICDYVTADLITSSTSITDTLKAIILIQNISDKKVEYPAYVSINLYDMINHMLYSSNISLDSDQYSSIENNDILSQFSMDSNYSYSKTIEFRNLFWNDGIILNELPVSEYKLRLIVNIQEPLNTGNLLQSEISLLEKTN